MKDLIVSVCVPAVEKDQRPKQQEEVEEPLHEEVKEKPIAALPTDLV
jgi:hypothetical protein